MSFACLWSLADRQNKACNSLGARFKYSNHLLMLLLSTFDNAEKAKIQRAAGESGNFADFGSSIISFHVGSESATLTNDKNLAVAGLPHVPSNAQRKTESENVSLSLKTFDA